MLVPVAILPQAMPHLWLRCRTPEADTLSISLVHNDLRMA